VSRAGELAQFSIRQKSVSPPRCDDKLQRECPREKGPGGGASFVTDSDKVLSETFHNESIGYRMI
jgi:hypothetical protein